MKKDHRSLIAKPGHPQPLILVLHVLDLLRHAVLLCLSSYGLAAPPAAEPLGAATVLASGHGAGPAHAG